MKKFLVPLMFVAIIAGLYEQSKDKPNVYILCLAVILFMYGMMNLSARIPGKNQKEEQEEKDVY